MTDGWRVADNVADAAALVVAFRDGDTRAIECLLANGCPRGIAMMCAGWLGVALAQLDPALAAEVVAGWRQRAEDCRM